MKQVHVYVFCPKPCFDVNQHASNKNIIKQCTFNLISKTH